MKMKMEQQIPIISRASQQSGQTAKNAEAGLAGCSGSHLSAFQQHFRLIRKDNSAVSQLIVAPVDGDEDDDDVEDDDDDDCAVCCCCTWANENAAAFGPGVYHKSQNNKAAKQQSMKALSFRLLCIQLLFIRGAHALRNLESPLLWTDNCHNNSLE